jgi:DNA polymerase-4
VVVGGDGDPTRPRQVVATASYEAREHGVRSGMPLITALRRCPDAVFLPSDKPAYEAASVEVMAALRTLGVVEEWGWDEACVGGRTDDPEGFARRIKATVLEATALHCAVGIGETKLQAKTATGFAKPGGIARLTRRTWLPVMGEKPVTAVSGIGDRTAARLADLGIETVAQLAAADHHELARHFGPTIGPYLRMLGLGGADAPVSGAPHVPKGRSREETFARDLVDPEEVAAEVVRLAEEVTASVAADLARRVTHVAVKVRTATFFTRSKIAKLPEPTLDPAVIASKALEVLARFEGGRPIRLLGVRVQLEPPA